MPPLAYGPVGDEVPVNQGARLGIAVPTGSVVDIELEFRGLSPSPIGLFQSNTPGPGPPLASVSNPFTGSCSGKSVPGYRLRARRCVEISVRLPP